MNQDVQLGAFEELVILAVLRLGDNAYGMTIRQTVQESTGRHASLGAVYTTLSRMEKKGFISSQNGEPVPQRDGRPRRYYRIEGAGVRVLHEAEMARQSLRGTALEGV